MTILSMAWARVKDRALQWLSTDEQYVAFTVSLANGCSVQNCG